MIKKTKQYDLFKFRDDNRARIDNQHVHRLADSIRSNNLLDLKPILVNKNMEVIDGQHRLLAAKLLDVDVYYEINGKVTPEDIVKLNISKAWTMLDYLNFYTKHDYVEYKKLTELMLKESLDIHIALGIVSCNSKITFHEFRMGNFKFTNELIDDQLEICRETIDHIKKMNGRSRYTSSARFWKSLLKLVKHEHFEVEKWRVNLHKMVDHFCVKATTQDYLRFFQNIYNSRNNIKINLINDEV